MFMSLYKVIEDCRPFYVKFTFTGIQDIIAFALMQTFEDSKCKICKGYTHKNFTEEIGKSIIEMLPMKNLFSFKENRVALFETPPGGGCGVHKDGTYNKVSFNIPIEVHDDMCKTYWYDDYQFLGVEVKGFPYTRNVYSDFRNLDQLIPIKTMVAKPNEMIVFNTDIFHSWHNKSNFSRKVLTLRTLDSNTLTFENATNLLF